MFVHHGDNEAFQQGQDAKESAGANEIDEEAARYVEILREVTGIMFALEEVADEHENCAEHLLDLIEASENDTPAFPSVFVVDGRLMVGGVAKVEGVRESSPNANGSYLREVAARHTINAAAYRRQARKLRMLLAEQG